MADIDPKVLDAVEAALKKNPDASVDELFEIARKIDREAVAGLSKRQFHARYPLQVKRKMAPTKKRSSGKRKAATRKRAAAANGSVRDTVRGSFLRFASDLAAAEARKDVVRVVANVDRYVDEVLKATGR